MLALLIALLHPADAAPHAWPVAVEPVAEGASLVDLYAQDHWERRSTVDGAFQGSGYPEGGKVTVVLAATHGTWRVTPNGLAAWNDEAPVAALPGPRPIRLAATLGDTLWVADERGVGVLRPGSAPVELPFPRARGIAPLKDGVMAVGDATLVRLSSTGRERCSAPLTVNVRRVPIATDGRSVALVTPEGLLLFDARTCAPLFGWTGDYRAVGFAGGRVVAWSSDDGVHSFALPDMHPVSTTGPILLRDVLAGATGPTVLVPGAMFLPSEGRSVRLEDDAQVLPGAGLVLARSGTAVVAWDANGREQGRVPDADLLELTRAAARGDAWMAGDRTHWVAWRAGVIARGVGAFPAWPGADDEGVVRGDPRGTYAVDLVPAAAARMRLRYTPTGTRVVDLSGPTELGATLPRFDRAAVAADGTLAVGIAGDALVAVETATGAVRWRVLVGDLGGLPPDAVRVGAGSVVVRANGRWHIYTLAAGDPVGSVRATQGPPDGATVALPGYQITLDADGPLVSDMRVAALREAGEGGWRSDRWGQVGDLAAWRVPVSAPAIAPSPEPLVPDLAATARALGWMTGRPGVLSPVSVLGAQAACADPAAALHAHGLVPALRDRLAPVLAATCGSPHAAPPGAPRTAPLPAVVFPSADLLTPVGPLPAALGLPLTPGRPTLVVRGSLATITAALSELGSETGIDVAWVTDRPVDAERLPPGPDERVVVARSPEPALELAEDGDAFVVLADGDHGRVGPAGAVIDALLRRSSGVPAALLPATVAPVARVATSTNVQALRTTDRGVLALSARGYALLDEHGATAWAVDEPAARPGLPSADLLLTSPGDVVTARRLADGLPTWTREGRPVGASATVAVLARSGRPDVLVDTVTGEARLIATGLDRGLRFEDGGRLVNRIGGWDVWHDGRGGGWGGVEGEGLPLPFKSTGVSAASASAPAVAIQGRSGLVALGIGEDGLVAFPMGVEDAAPAWALSGVQEVLPFDGTRALARAGALWLVVDGDGRVTAVLGAGDAPVVANGRVWIASGREVRAWQP